MTLRPFLALAFIALAAGCAKGPDKTAAADIASAK